MSSGPEVSIRPARIGDGPALSALYRRSVRELGPRRYTPEQVEAWAGLAPPPQRFDSTLEDGRLRLVAVRADDGPIAVADLESDGHIDLFYCAPEAAGRGVAAALYGALEQAAVERAMDRLYAEASAIAKGFFERQGFTVLGRRDFLVAGVPIHNFAVEKRLAQPPQR